jgi:hypothetical protein
MPYFRKEALSKYIGTGCQKQLRLYLTPDNARFRVERDAEGMPPPQPPRPGLEHIRQEGEEWGAAKVSDLAQAFGSSAVVGRGLVHETGQTRYKEMELEEAIKQAAAGKFLIEAQYSIGKGFEAALGIEHLREKFGLEYADVRPDIIEVLPGGHCHRFVRPNGDLGPIPVGDTRLQLRPIDVKLTAEPSPPYFAEVTFYSMALAGWLVDRSLDGRFVVVPDGAVWPGTHDASRLTTTLRAMQAQGLSPSSTQLRAALEEDLEQVPFEAFSFRLQRFFREELPDVLARHWDVLPFHVDNRCKGCEFLGQPWLDKDGNRTDHPDHCIPAAMQKDHLSRVAFISRGASAALQERGIADVAALASITPTHPAFDAHYELRATRTVVSGRASSLRTRVAQIPPASGTSAIMPRWADLRIYLSADYDLGSAITFAFGLNAFWIQPQPRFPQLVSQAPASTEAPRRTESWDEVFIVDQKDLDAEQRELLALLDQIDNILTRCKQSTPKTTVQFFIWDDLQYEHLTRVIGRHLPAILRNRRIEHLAWLFPPQELLPNPQLVVHRKPVTVVRNVIRALLAAPIPHYYSLLQIARVYHHEALQPPVSEFRIHPLFEDPLSDQIPSERAHEVWARSTKPRHWRRQMDILEETVKKRLNALGTVTRRLTQDLGSALTQTAAPINIAPLSRLSGVSADGQLWYAFAKLNEALEELEVLQKRAMPPHEREARFDSARLLQRLEGQEAADALGSYGLSPDVGRMVYRLRAESREVKLREGDFNFALSPESMPGYLEKFLANVAQGTWLEPSGHLAYHLRMDEALAVTVRAVDRDKCMIVLDASSRWIRTDPSGRSISMFEALESLGLADFSRHVILDPTHHDFFTKRLENTLIAIGNPTAAESDPVVLQAVGQQRGRGSKRSADSPTGDVLWNALRLHNERVSRQLAPIRSLLEGHGRTLNDMQWQAWEESLTRRLQLIWGPPGTGKSRTVTSIILGAALEANLLSRPIRILLAASTYTAIDNVLTDVYREIEHLLPRTYGDGLFRLRSSYAPPAPEVLQAVDTPLNRRSPSQQINRLWRRLSEPSETTLVAATAQQVHNLLTMNNGPARQEVFDLIVVDEASQMDVAQATLALSALAANGSVVLAGDPLQLAPIHKADPPTGLEGRVGSIYNYFACVHDVGQIMLNENYRSNAMLVRFALEAGYRSDLTSYSPDLRLELHPEPPTNQPEDWPGQLYWTTEWGSLLDPSHSAVCFVYPDGRSSQSNPFEADAVAALVELLSGRLCNQLADERDPSTGAVGRRANQSVLYSPEDFWKKGLGVVTPHRAQQGLIISRLQEMFPSVRPSLIREAVDTVERFQGQQRDVIIASFALGDPDAILREDEFLHSLNRFNVLASRARAKLIVLVSQEVVDHLSADLEVLRESRLLKLFAQSFCSNARQAVLGHVVDGDTKLVPGQLRYR